MYLYFFDAPNVAGRDGFVEQCDQHTHRPFAVSKSTMVVESSLSGMLRTVPKRIQTSSAWGVRGTCALRAH